MDAKCEVAGENGAQMQFSKSILKPTLLASGGFIAAAVAAQAADLPSRKSAPVDYVRVCDAYGGGFFYIPGTDTCLRVGGYVRAEYAYVSTGGIVFAPNGVVGKAASASNAPFVPGRNEDTTGFMARGRVNLDARTQTPWGTVRTFIGIRLAANGGLYSLTGGTGSITGAGVTGIAGGTALTLEQAIIQFAGFTFGRTTAETFAFIPPYNYNSFSWAGFPGGINMLAYTASFGGGVTATLALEDRSGLSASTKPSFIANSAVAGTAAGGSIINGPYSWPALVGNIRVDQGWGAAQVMGAVVQNAATTTYLTAPTQQTLTKTGYAVGAGVKFNLPMIAAGDTLYLTGAYADGGMDWLESYSTSAALANLNRDLNGLTRRDGNLAVYCATALGCGAEQTSGYSFGGHFTHYWTPTIRSVVLASYLHAMPGKVTQNTDWTLGGLSKADLYNVAVQLVWSPVKDLNIGAELTYQRLSQRLTGTNGAAPTAVPVSWGGWEPSSSVYEARLRVDRQF
jgi:hypothetical protein